MPPKASPTKENIATGKDPGKTVGDPARGGKPAVSVASPDKKVTARALEPSKAKGASPSKGVAKADTKPSKAVVKGDRSTTPKGTLKDDESGTPKGSATSGAKAAATSVKPVSVAAAAVKDPEGSALESGGESVAATPTTEAKGAALAKSDTPTKAATSQPKAESVAATPAKADTFTKANTQAKAESVAAKAPAKVKSESKSSVA